MVDLIKFLCSFMVFFVHFPLFQKADSGLAWYIGFGLKNHLFRIAVPFYFACSGFFLFKKMPPDEINADAVKTFCFKLLRLAGLWHILLFMGGTYHLWYLGATAAAVISLSLCFRFHLKYKHIFLLAGVCYVCGLLGDSYYGLVRPLTDITLFRYLFKGYDLVFQTTRNGLFMGFIFVAIGAALAHCEIKLKPRTAFAGFVISMLCMLAEALLVEHYGLAIDFFSYNMYICLPFALFFLLAFALSVRLKDRPVYKHLRHMATLIYFSHLLVESLVTLGVQILNKWVPVHLGSYRTFVALFFVVLFAFCIEWLSCREKFKWLKWLFS